MTMTEDTRKAIEANRARYEALKLAGQANAPRALPPPTKPGDAPLVDSQILKSRTIPPGWYDNIFVQRGTALRLVNLDGTSSVSLIAWNAHDISERINHADTIKVQWTANMQKGRIILSDMGRVMFSILEDTCAAHDCLVGGSTEASTTRKYGQGYRNTRDNFVLAAGKFGLSKADIPLAITFFAPVGVAENGRFSWNADKLQRGDFIDLKAEMDLLIAVSNCPHPVNPATAYASGPVDVIEYLPSAEAASLCRTASDEAIRAFENTDALVTA